MVKWTNRSYRLHQLAGYGPSWNGTNDNIVLVQDDVQESRRRQEIDNFAIDLKLVNDQLKYTKINEDDLRYPLCMHGKPADGTDSAINVKPTNLSLRMKQKGRNKQKKLKLQRKKNLKKIHNKNNKRKNQKPSSRGRRQADCTGIDTCAVTGDNRNNKIHVITLTINVFILCWL